MNFRSIILPEAVKAIQAQNASVCSALQDLEKLFTDAGYSTETIIAQLESLHRNAIMGCEVQQGLDINLKDHLSTFKFLHCLKYQKICTYVVVHVFVLSKFKF